jgi:chemotaxis protein CheX
MPAIEDIPETVFQDTVSRAVHRVFSTMLGRSAVLEPIDSPTPPDATELEHPHVVGTVGFIGSINGLIYLYLAVPFAQECASHLLGMNAAQLAKAGDEAVNDAIGEITNMTVGTFKNQLSDRGFPCRLTIPSILRCSRISIKPMSSATRRIYRFKIGSHILTADLLMQTGE